MSAECIFCKIVRGEIPSMKIAESEKSYAFLDINPINRGHVLVIPKEHYTTIFGIPDEVLTDLIIMVKKLSKAAYKAVNAEGLNVIQNNFSAAGQLVDHAHFHIIPRFMADGFLTSWPGKPVSETELQVVQGKIKSQL